MKKETQLPEDSAGANFQSWAKHLLHVTMIQQLCSLQKSIGFIRLTTDELL